MVTVVATGALSVAAMPHALGAPAAGVARVIGSAATGFTLALPEGAACPGDSASDNYRVQSYMVRVNVDPATLRFGSTGPQPPGVGADLRQPLYQTTSTGYVNAQTANADFPGDSGAIVNIPQFSLSVFGAGDLPPGAYNVGIACTRGPASGTQLVRFWNATLTVGAAPDLSASPASSSADAAAVAAAPRVAAAATRPEAAPKTAREPELPALAEPTGGAPSLALPAMQIPAHVRAPGSSLLVAAAWALGLALVARCGWLVRGRARSIADRQLSVLEDA